MSRKSENIKAWRIRTKKRLVEAFGGFCCVCKQTFPDPLFDFHHINPIDKAFGIGATLSSIKSWESLVAEVKKCVMLCANCHRLVEYMGVSIPVDAFTFNKDLIVSSPVIIKHANHLCPICDQLVLRLHTYCSVTCARIGHRVVKNRPPKADLLLLIASNGYEGTGRLFGVTGNAVKKWIK